MFYLLLQESMEIWAHFKNINYVRGWFYRTSRKLLTRIWLESIIFYGNNTNNKSNITFAGHILVFRHMNLDALQLIPCHPRDSFVRVGNKFLFLQRQQYFRTSVMWEWDEGWSSMELRTVNAIGSRLRCELGLSSRNLAIVESCVNQ